MPDLAVEHQTSHNPYPVPLALDEDRPPRWKCRACGLEFDWWDGFEDSECDQPGLFVEVDL